MPSEGFSATFRGVTAIAVGDEAWADALASALGVAKHRVEHLVAHERLRMRSSGSEGLDGSGMSIEEAQALANRTGMPVSIHHDDDSESHA
jgi:hypothetical protein